MSDHVCQKPGCGEKYSARGLCRSHYGKAAHRGELPGQAKCRFTEVKSGERCLQAAKPTIPFGVAQTAVTVKDSSKVTGTDVADLLSKYGDGA